MKISVDWLSEFTNIPDDTQYLADRLTDIGLEVEQIHRLDRHIEGVYVATVQTAERHPDKPQLIICELSCGEKEATVVTAAPRVRPGQQYLWAQPGAELPDQSVGRETIADVESDGMLCSSRELGLTDDAQTLLSIPEDTEEGTTAVELLDLDDPLLELDLTPNRSDCLSHLGVARDLAAAEGQTLDDPRPTQGPNGPDTEVDICIDDQQGCPSYTGISVSNLEVDDAPWWIRKRLLKMGLRPLNNIVDITNYTLFEVGHPLHPFDADKLGDEVNIRRAQTEETLNTLDGEKRELTGDDLVIADGSNPVALAGIMGGEPTEVSSRTDSLFLEGAYFDPTQIRRTSSRHKMHTEASHRFERGTDPLNYERCLYRCVELIGQDPAQTEELVVHAPARATHDRPKPDQIQFDPETVKDLIGLDVEHDQMQHQLEALGIDCSDPDGDWTLNCPSWRQDLERSEDIVEEIVRLQGYEDIPLEHASIPIEQTPTPDTRKIQQIRELLTAHGFDEAITYSFVDEQQHQFVENGDPYTLANPVASHQSTMRRSLLDGLLATLKHQADETTQSLRLFETGHVFPANDQPEFQQVGVMLTGQTYPEDWDGSAREMDLYDIKGLIKALMERVGVDRVEWTADETAPGFVDNRTAQCEDQSNVLGVCGEIQHELVPDVLDGPVWASKLNLDRLPDVQTTQFEAYSTQPVVTRDFDLVVDRGQYTRPLKQCIEDEAKWLENVLVFDVYQGDPLPDDKKSISFNMKFRHPRRTPEAEEINSTLESVFDTLRNRFDATLREQ